MEKTIQIGRIISGLFAILLIAIGVLNLIFVHPVPGIVYLLIALLYFPSTNEFLRNKTGLAIPAIVKIGLGVVLMLFTLGVSDLGDMIDKL